MKNKLFIMGFLASSFSMISTAAAVEVSIKPSNVHVPVGFDSNDKVEVIVTGLLPDTCHRRPTGRVKIKGQEVTLEMKADKVSGRGVYCIKAMVPYMVPVTVGQLPEGSYSIVADSKIHNLEVDSPSSASIDNFTYANVTSVKKTDNNSLLISGEHPSNCMVVDKVEIIANEVKDTVSVLPIVTQTSEACNLVMTPFSVEVPFNIETTTDVVFHVRRIDGTAINFHW